MYPLEILIDISNFGKYDSSNKHNAFPLREPRVRSAGVVYLLTFIVIVIIARIAGPIHRHRDLDQERRQAEYEHRVSVYGEPDSGSAKNP
jgi:hypothetical protein